MSNKEQISKLISYWLRHNPSDGNLMMDEFGWVPTASLLMALNNKNSGTTLEDILILNQSFDKIRWEFNEDGTTIRATHGHSVPVILPNDEAIPPSVLYHGTSVANFYNILLKGLQPMERQFVHLSANIQTAVEVAKRYGKPIIIEINTEALSKTGSSFYQTSDNVWLTTAISAEYLSFEPWHVVNNEDKNTWREQLSKEAAPEHILANKLDNIELIMRRHDRDDALFVDKENGAIYSVHLTWQGKQSGDHPRTRAYNSFIDWAKTDFISDQNDWYLL